MNGELVSPSGSDHEDVVLSGGQRVSMQLLQQMYKDVTGKTERITRNFVCNHRTEFADLENLNSKIEHLLEQYNVAEKSCTVSFFHTNDSTERYSSFDRARALEQASTSPLENVRIQYDFLIVLPVAKKPQPYKITVDVHSRAAIAEKLREKSRFEAKFFAVLSDGTGAAAIEYVDYAVARTMMEAVAQWFDGLHQEPASPFMRVAKKWSHHFDWVAKYLTATILSFFFLREIYQASSLGQMGALLAYGAVAFCSIFVFSGIAYQMGMVIESAVDSYQPLSYLKINRGDERVMQAFTRHKAKWFWKAICSLLVALLLNILGTWLAQRLHI